VQTPLLALPVEELGQALASFALPPGESKPDLLHWLPLLNQLDELLRRATSRTDVALAAPDASPFPVGDTLAALRATTLLLDCSHNRQLYGSAEVRSGRVAGARAKAAVASGATAPPSRPHAPPAPRLSAPGRPAGL
jgi:hypothetical protein